MALPFLRGFAERGLTPSQAIAELKPLDLTFNRQRMLDVYAALQERTDPERLARLVGQDIPIPQDLHAPSVNKQSNNYQYEVGAFDENGDALGYVTVGSYVGLAGNQIRTLAMRLFTEDASIYLDRPKVPINSISIVSATVSNEVPII